MYRGKCGYCGKEHVLVESTPEVDSMCIDCHRLARDNCNEVIRQLKAAGADRGKGEKEDISVLKQRADDALEKLMKGKIYGTPNARYQNPFLRHIPMPGDARR